MRQYIERAAVCALTIAGCSFAPQNRLSSTEVADYFSSFKKVEASSVPIMPVIPDCPDTNRLYLPSLHNTGENSPSSGVIINTPDSPEKIDQVPIIPSALVLKILTSEFENPFPDPAGLDVVTISGKTYLVVSDSEVNETDLFAGKNVAFVDPTTGEVISTTTTTAFSNEPTGVTVDSNGGLITSDDDKDRIFTTEPTTALGERLNFKFSFSTRQFGSFDPEGISLRDKSLFIADGAGEEMFMLIDGGDGEANGPCFPGDDRVFAFSTADFGRDFEGVYATSHPENLNETRLYMVDRRNPSQIFVVRINEGQTLAMLEFIIQLPDELRGVLLNLAGVAVLPNGDIAVVDRGVDNDADPAENDGVLAIIRPDQGNLAYSVSPNHHADLLPFSDKRDRNHSALYRSERNVIIPDRQQVRSGKIWKKK